MKTWHVLALPAMIAGLTACGGGGGDGATPGAQASLSGVVSKGLMVNADVIVEELKADGTVRGVVANGTTGSDGAYTITQLASSYAGGPLRLKAVPGTSTVMICDVKPGCAGGIAFGANMPLPATFSLSALVPSVAKGVSKVSITALTDMAAGRALQLATTGSTVALTNAQIIAANSEVSQIVGVNILTTSPANAVTPGNAGAEAKTYAAFLAGIGELANAQPTGTTFGEKLAAQLGSLSTSFADGQLSGADGVTAANIVNAVNSQVGLNTGLENDLVTLATQQITSQTSGGNYNPEPGSNANATPIAQAKALLDEARTFASALAPMGEGPAPAITDYSDDLVAVEAVSNERSVALFSRITDIMDGLNAAADAAEDPVTGFGIGDSATFEGYTLNIPDATGSQIVTATITDNNSEDGVTFTNVSMSTGLTANQIAAVNDDTWTNLGSPLWTLTGTVASASAQLALSNVHLRIGPVTRPQATCTDIQQNMFGLCDPNMIETIDFGGTATYTDLVNHGSFSGTFAFTSVKLLNKRSQFSSTSPRNLLLRGTFSGGDLGGSAEAELNLTLNNAAQFDSVDEGWFETRFASDVLGAEAYAANYLDVPAGTLISASYYGWSNETCFESDMDFICVEGDVLYAKNKVRADAVGTYGYPSSLLVSDINFDEYFYAHEGANRYSSFSAEMPTSFLDTPTYFANITASGHLNTSIPDFGPTNIAFVVNRDGYNTGNSSLTVTRGGDVFTLTGSCTVCDSDKSNSPENRTFSLRNADGVRLNVNATAVDGDSKIEGGTVLMGTTQIGTIDGNGVIHYSDGTLGSLM